MRLNCRGLVKRVVKYGTRCLRFSFSSFKIVHPRSVLQGRKLEIASVRDVFKLQNMIILLEGSVMFIDKNEAFSFGDPITYLVEISSFPL